MTPVLLCIFLYIVDFFTGLILKIHPELGEKNHYAKVFVVGWVLADPSFNGTDNWISHSPMSPP